MHSTHRDFVGNARQAGRIRFGDLRRLQREFLPARVTTREEAEALIALDGSVTRADPDWTNYLVGTIRDFVVWGLRPAGLVDRHKAEWLVRVLSAGDVSKTGRTIAREVAEEACEVDRVLLAFVAGGPKRPSRESVKCANKPEPENKGGIPPGRVVPDLDRPPPDRALDRRHQIINADIEEPLCALDLRSRPTNSLAIAFAPPYIQNIGGHVHGRCQLRVLCAPASNGSDRCLAIFSTFMMESRSSIWTELSFRTSTLRNRRPSG